MSPPVFENRFLELLCTAQQSATRPYRARGIAVPRCQRCRLAEARCICPWRVELDSEIDVILLFHHDEVFKPTNSGRLVADVLPRNTYAFEWSRTKPPLELLDMLQDPARQCLLLYPSAPQTGNQEPSAANIREPSADSNEEPSADSIKEPSAFSNKEPSAFSNHQPSASDPKKPSKAEIASSYSPLLNDRKVTLIALDGTWKQAAKMYRLSPWLQALRRLPLAINATSAYTVRQAPKAGQVATAEALACAFSQCGDRHIGTVIQDYFTVFRLHYVATRNNVMPTPDPAHARLGELKALLQSANGARAMDCKRGSAG